MPISEQEGAGEFISIKRVWLRQLDRCNEALSNYPLKLHHDDDSSGIRAAISSVGVLIINLIDFGDAPIKSDYLKWRDENIKTFDGKHQITIAQMKLEQIIEILNKYQMLHDSLPRGYSNVILEGVKEAEKNE